MEPSHPHEDISLRALYPSLTEQELIEAEETLGRYIALVLRIYERIAADPEALARLSALTEPDQSPTLKEERSNVHL